VIPPYVFKFTHSDETFALASRLLLSFRVGGLVHVVKVGVHGASGIDTGRRLVRCFGHVLPLTPPRMMLFTTPTSPNLQHIVFDDHLIVSSLHSRVILQRRCV
jgi:hypothetical protein